MDVWKIDMLLRAGCLILGGIACFAISYFYNNAERKLDETSVESNKPQKTK